MHRYSLILCLLFAGPRLLSAAEPPARPNILWISCEDTGLQLGCYGDPYAITPHLNDLARESLKFTRCFAHAGVCAPSRSGLITGMYPSSIGTQHMRCKGVPPLEVRCFTERLRANGYYCTNQSKTDYQFDSPFTAWDANGNNADWRGRGKQQPFFSVINFTTSHESQVRDPSPATKKLVNSLPKAQRHDPAAAIVPKYYPDTPVIRRDLANCADNVTAMDLQVGEVLKRLEADGLSEDTIVWFWGDHGAGLPRSKRWLYDSGTQVPLLIRVPKKWRAWAGLGEPGSRVDDLVAFVDFAPTLLSLAGVPVPPELQGQAFLGPERAKTPRQYVYGARDRMDETYDLIRMVRDGRYQYLRNFRPELTYAQDISYMNQMPTMQDWRRLAAAGQLSGPPALFFRPTKPLEELYDTATDPDEVNNLAELPQHRETLLRMRAECDAWMTRIHDVGLVPEPILNDLQRPNGQVATTFPPSVIEIPEGNARRIVLRPTTPGSSLAYQTGEKGWHVYSEPFLEQPGTKIRAKAIRLGYKESEATVWTVGQPPPQSQGANPPRIPEWNQALRDSGTLTRLLALRQLDFDSPDARRTAYRAALTDEQPAMRWWAVWGLTQSAVALPFAEAQPLLTQRLASETDPAVRVLLARALVLGGATEPALQTLGEILKTGRHDSTRLAAITALRDAGRAALPLREAIEAAKKDGEYTGRIAQNILGEWGKKAP